MNRWNISAIFFLGIDGRRRDIVLEPGEMNIITGASGTGKSTLIKAIDYCLGSSKCELPVHVRRRTEAVGVKWVNGEAEMVVGRIVPPVGQDTSTKMFITSGRNLSLPTTLDGFDGSTNLSAAKAFLERAFGIGDAPGEPDIAGYQRGRATIRHITPYMFVTKEVIYSETVLLHGLDSADEAYGIIETMPYFLRATDEGTAVDERRLRQLQRVLEKEEARESARISAGSELRQRASNLLSEAHRIGLVANPPGLGAEVDLLAQLRRVAETELGASLYPGDEELDTLQASRRNILNGLASARKRLYATKTAIRESSGFQNTVARQHEKLVLAEHLGLTNVGKKCPLCDSTSDRGREMANALEATLSKVRAESAAVERLKPKLVQYDIAIEEEILSLNLELRNVDDKIQSWIRQTEEAKRLANLGQLRAHLLGRISYFLESYGDRNVNIGKDLDVIRKEIADLETRVNRDVKAVKLARAERKISEYATEAFLGLPTVAPCIDSELDFSSRKPEITVIEAGTGAVLRMPDVGSDQNYLAIHIALSFGLQRFLEFAKSPVPGVLILDQVSRPYFPTNGEYDEEQIDGREEDEDVVAMKRHINFLFQETARRKGLQVLLIEHAYFVDDPRYTAATRERWTRSSGKALIPLDWPVRSDK